MRTCLVLAGLAQAAGFQPHALRAPANARAAPRGRPAAASTVQMMLPGFTIAEAVDAVTAGADAVAEVAKDDWFAGFVNIIEGGIKALHAQLGEGTFGISIVLFTLAIKLATFPLNFAQIESTTKMQALQPAIKRIQAKYANDPQQMNVMMAELYSENELNPLAGCLPAFAQIPIFIALYRALINLAKEDLLEEPFLWLPNLEGPTYGAQNADWLFKFDAWNGNAPPLGWHDTIAYLTLPVLLIVAQSVSAQLLKPPQTGPETDQQQTTNAVLKYLPLLVGVFSLNVPSGLTVYWFVNNIFTTASTLYIRSTVGTVTMGGADVAAKETKKSKKSSEATSFDAMMVGAPKKLQNREVVVDAVVGASSNDMGAVVIDESADDDEMSKSAAKKQAKASKTRRSKKTRA